MAEVLAGTVMRIVIPGGSGQVGQVLARHFHQDGNHVTVLNFRRNRLCPQRTSRRAGPGRGGTRPIPRPRRSPDALGPGRRDAAREDRGGSGSDGGDRGSRRRTHDGSGTVLRRVIEMLGRPIVALLVALLIGGIFIAVVQGSIAAPFTAYRSLFTGAFGNTQAWANTLKQTTPLLLTGAAVAVALAAGLFNIGAEGQMAVGGLVAAIVGSSLKDVLPEPLLLVVALLAGVAAGAVWAFLPAFLKVKRGAHEVITAILLNYVAQNVTRYLATFPLKDPASQSPATREVGATLHRLTPDYDVHQGLIVAAVVVAFVAFALRRSVWGYETRATGEGIGAAEAAGIAVNRVQIIAMMFSGALAGLAGAVTILGATPFRRFPADFYGVGYGFDGLAVALLAGGSIPGVFPAALLFGAMTAGAQEMEFNDTPKQIVMVVQAVLIVAVAARVVLRRRRSAK